MRIASFALVGLVAGAALVSIPVSAAAQMRGGNRSAATAGSTLFDITPYAGYMVFGNFLSGHSAHRSAMRRRRSSVRSSG